MLADPLARDIMECIAVHPGLTVTDVCTKFPVSRFAVMRHLNALEEAELIWRERAGQNKRLYVEHDTLARLANGWLHRLAKHRI